MFRSYVVVTVLAAAANLYAASNDFRQVDWVLANMARLGIPKSRLFALGILKTAGGLGLLADLVIPWIGTAAAIGLILFFLVAVACTLRVRWYAHLPIPAIWLGLAVGALLLRRAVSSETIP